MATPKKIELNFKENMFIYSYMQTFNLSAAGRMAKCCPKTMMLKGYVQKAIHRAMKDRIKKLKVDADWVLHELVTMYHAADMANVLGFYERSGVPYIDLKNTPDEVLSILETVQIKPGQWGTDVKVTMPTKLEILKQIGKHVNVNAFKEADINTQTVIIHLDKQDIEPISIPGERVDDIEPQKEIE